MKTCQTCGETKPHTEFHKRSKAKDGLQSRCKKCNRQQRNDYYKIAAGRESNRLSGRKIRERNRSIVYNYLLKNPCVCGESDPAALDFDHDDPSIKSFGIGSPKALACSLDRLYDEMNKCTVRCANCHRKRTAKQFGWYSTVLNKDH